jgi:hypothetical protein
LFSDFRSLCPDTVPRWNATCNHTKNSIIFYMLLNILCLMKQFMLCPLGIHTQLLSLHINRQKRKYVSKLKVATPNIYCKIYCGKKNHTCKQLSNV